MFCFSLLWCHQESNRGHKDFQSFALPTELWHHRLLIAGAKVVKIIEAGERRVAKVADFNFFFDLYDSLVVGFCR